MTKYLEEKQLADLKEFSAYIYQGFNTNRQVNSLAINLNRVSREKSHAGKIDLDTFQLQVFEYYQKFNESLGFSQHGKTYRDAYGAKPKKAKYCKSCAKKHQLYLEKHNQTKVSSITQQKKEENRQLFRQELHRVNQELIKQKTQTRKLIQKAPPVAQPKVTEKQIKTIQSIKPVPSMTKMLLDQNVIIPSITKKPRQRKAYITDQRYAGKKSPVINQTIKKQKNTKVTRQQPSKTKKQPEKTNLPKFIPVVGNPEAGQMKPVQKRMQIVRPSGKIINKKVVPVIPRQKRFISFTRSRIIRVKGKNK